MRGIAMILIAVAILLLLWWVFTMPGKSGDENNRAAGTTTTAAVTSTAAAENSAPSTSSAAETPTSAEAPTEETTAPNGESSQPPAAPGEVKVHVLNNSTIQGLAADVAKRIQADGEVTNLPSVELPNSVVFFSPADEQRAREIADELGIVAQPKIPEVEGYDGIVVVVTQDLSGVQ